MPTSNDREPFSQAEHDRAAEVGGIVLWACAVALIVAAIVVGGLMT